MTNQDNWKYRRWTVFTTLAYVGAAFIWLMHKLPTSDIAAKIADTLGTLATVTIVAYLGAPIADDYLRRKQQFRAPLPRPDNPDDP